MPSLKLLLSIVGAGIGLISLAAPTVAAAPPALGDPCLVGRWVEVEESSPGNWTWDGEVIAMRGLAGVVVSFRPEGVEVTYFAGSQPLIGDYHGHQIKAVLRGGIAYHAHADGRQITLTAPASDVQVTFYYDGALQSGGTVNFATTETDTYTCSATRLHTETPAMHAGYGPQVDDLTRPATAAGSALSAPGSVLSTVGTSLPTPANLLAAPLTLLVNAVLALVLVLFVTFPSHLFNRTYEENHDTIRQWWEKWLPSLRRLRLRAMARGPQGLRDALGFGAVAICGGVLAAVLDPRFGFSWRTFALFAGAVFALAAGSVVSAVAAGVYRIARHKRGPWHVHALPSGLVVAAVCVLISRLADFQPGYLYGLIGGIVFARELSSREEGHVVAVTSVATLGVAIAAWLVWVPVSSQSLAHPTNFGSALAANFLAALFISGIVGLLIGLLPLRFLPGEKLAKWHMGAWGALFGLAALGVIEVMLSPRSASARVGSVAFWTTVGLFVGFGIASLLFWGYFRVRREAKLAAKTSSARSID